MFNPYNSIKEALFRDAEGLDIDEPQCHRYLVAAALFCAETGLQIEIAFNGPEPGTKCTGEKGKCGCVHAEQNLLRDRIHQNCTEKFFLVITYSPCQACVDLILEHKKQIKAVYYRKKYRKGIYCLTPLLEAGIAVIPYQAIEGV